MNTDSITSNNPIVLTIQDNTDSGQISQSHQSFTDTFNNILTTGTHNGQTRYSNNWLQIDKSNESNSTTIVSTLTFGTGQISLNANGASSYEFTGWQNRYAAGRNKRISVNMTNGSSTSNGMIQLRYQDSTHVWASVYLASNGIGIIQKNSGFSGLYGPTSFTGYSSTKNYTVHVKTFENLVAFLLIDTVSFPTTVINHCFAIDNNNYKTITGVNNGLGINASTTVYKNFTSATMNNFTNVICIGDSNTQDPNGLLSTGQDYVSLLNHQFRDKNVYFQNHGHSGQTTYEFGQGGSLDIAGILNSRTVAKAKNVVTVLLGTNDAAENNGHTFNLATTISNIDYIIKTCREYNCQVWFATYFPRNLNGSVTTAVMVQRVVDINNYIRQSSADKIIDLWALFVDPIYYDTSNNIERAIPSYLDTDKLHLTVSGANLVFQTFAKLVWKELASNYNASSVVVNKTLTLTDSVAPLIQFADNGVALPSLNSASAVQSAGSKIILYKNVVNTLDYAIGVSNMQVWFGSGGGFGFYNNSATACMTIGSSGIVSVLNNTAATSTVSGALQVTGGVGIQGAIYAGNIFSNGVQVPTTVYTGTGNITVSSGVINTINNPTFSGVTTISNATAATNTSSGALQVTGGAGIQGALYAGNIFSTGSNTGAFTPSNILNNNSSSPAPYALGVYSPNVPTGNSTGMIMGKSNSTGDAAQINFFYNGANNSSSNIAFSFYGGGGSSFTMNNSTGTGFVLNGGSVAIGNTTNASSTTTGALTIVGGAGIQGNLYAANIFSNGSQVVNTAGTNISISGATVNVVSNPTFSGVVTLSNTAGVNTTGNGTGTGALTLAGGLALNGTGTLGNTIYFTSSGLGAPTSASRSAGTKIVLYPTIGSNSDFGIGVQSGGTWYSVPSSTDFHLFYHNTTLTCSMSSTATSFASTNSLIINNTTSSSSSTTGAIQNAGGMYTGGNSLAAGIWTFSNATAATNTTSGAVKITGGLGVQGAIYGANIFSNGSQVVNTAGTNISISGATVNVVSNPTFSGVSTFTSTTGSGDFIVRGSCTFGDGAGSTIYRNLHYNQMSYNADSTGTNLAPFSVTGTNVLVGAGGIYTFPTAVTPFGSITQFGTGIAIRAAAAATVTNMCTVRIVGPCTTSANMTFTNNWSLYIDTGNVFIGDNLIVSGTINKTTPSNPTFTSISNTSSVSVSTISKTTNGSENTLKLVLIVTPTAASTLTSFSFPAPGKSGNFNSIFNLHAVANGYDTSNGFINNLNCSSINASLNVLVQFVSNNVSAHYISAVISYEA